MDSSGLQSSASISSNCENEKDASAMIESRRSQFFANYQTQEFHLPDSIMFFIAKNPTTPELYQKMIQSCKNFFVKNPIIVVSQFIYYGGDKWRISEEICRLSLYHRPIDLSKITSKIWITNQFWVYPNSFDKTAANQDTLTSVMSKLYKCDAKALYIENQTFSFRDLSLLISFAKNIYFNNVTVKYQNGENVAVEKIVEVAVKAKGIQILSVTNFLSVTSETVKELLKLPHFSKLDKLSLYQIPEAFDLETFYGYMKQNKTTKIYLSFHNSISQASKNRIEEIVDEILATKNRGYKAPFIGFAGINFDKRLKLGRIFSSY